MPRGNFGFAPVYKGGCSIDDLDASTVNIKETITTSITGNPDITIAGLPAEDASENNGNVQLNAPNDNGGTPGKILLSQNDYTYNWPDNSPTLNSALTISNVSGQDIELGWAAAGTGDVVGPASSTDNTVALFDGATGKLIKETSGSNVFVWPTVAPTVNQILAATAVGGGSVTMEWVDDASGTGDVVGPASSTDNTVALFDGITGKLIKETSGSNVFVWPTVAPTVNQILAATAVGGGSVTMEWVDDAAGTGDVVGPASSTDNTVALFDGATGKLIKDTSGSNVFVWPTVAPTANQILAATSIGGGTATMEWVDDNFLTVAGSANDIQINDGSNDLGSASLSTFSFVDSATTPALNVGVENGTFSITGQEATTAATSGSDIDITGGLGNTSGSGGGINILSGLGGASGDSGAATFGTNNASVDSGDVSISTGIGTTNSGDIDITTGTGFSGASGAINISTGFGATSSGTITLTTGVGAVTRGDINLEALTGTVGITASSTNVTGDLYVDGRLSTVNATDLYQRWELGKVEMLWTTQIDPTSMTPAGTLNGDASYVTTVNNRHVQLAALAGESGDLYWELPSSISNWEFRLLMYLDSGITFDQIRFSGGATTSSFTDSAASFLSSDNIRIINGLSVVTTDTTKTSDFFVGRYREFRLRKIGTEITSIYNPNDVGSGAAEGQTWITTGTSTGTNGEGSFFQINSQIVTGNGQVSVTYAEIRSFDY